MAQMWAGIRFIGRRLKVRLYAGRRKPSFAGALFGVAQLDATAMGQGFMTVARTCRGRNGLQARGHIAVEVGDRQKSEEDYSGHANIAGSVGNDGEKQRVHASWCGDSGEKPIAQ
jgi:hypothetical protein